MQVHDKRDVLMTIDGVEIGDLFKAYEAANTAGDR